MLITTTVSITDLFSQLGLESDTLSIDRFINSHYVEPTRSLERAPFWTEVQSQFIYEAREEDSEWCEVIDMLDARLRAPLMPDG